VTARRRLVTAVALLFAAAVAGCGFGPGSSSEGTATLTVTRDYGTQALVGASDHDPAASETVIRMLDREAEITTRYGGGFVQSIDGVSGTERGGRRYDWFFYVNGVESPVGAADVRVHGGDRIWWDYRDWTSAMRVPAVVGSWPEPFAQSSATGDRRPIRVECSTAGEACQTVADRLADVGVHASVDRGKEKRSRGSDALRLLVGPWSEVRSDGAVDDLRGGPATNGVFATFKGPIGGAYDLIALDPTAEPSTDLGSRAGLVAALHEGDGPPTWIVTGSKPSAVLRAARLLDAKALRDRYAVAAPAHGHPLALPVDGGRE
jgi:hypothetical protein